MSLLCLNTISRHDVKVIMGALKLCLHFGKLVLDAVHLNTSVFTLLLDFSNFFLLLTQLKINTLVLISQLFGQGSLEPSHEVMVSWKVADVTRIVEVLIHVLLVFAKWSLVIKTRTLRELTNWVISVRLLNTQEVIIYGLIRINSLIEGWLHIGELLIDAAKRHLLTGWLTSHVLLWWTLAVHVNRWWQIWWRLVCWLSGIHVGWWLFAALWRAGTGLIVILSVHLI